MAKKRTPSGITDQLREYIQELPLRRALPATDRRSVARTQRLERELSGEYRASTIAETLGISTQKWVAMRRGIRAGSIASPEVGSLLSQTSQRVEPVKELASVEFTADIPGKGRRKQEGQVWEINDTTWIKDNAPWMKDLKPAGFADKKSALNWWGNAGAGSEYFALVKQKHKTRSGTVQTRYHVYDMRTPSELANKGRNKSLRIEKKLKR